MKIKKKELKRLLKENKPVLSSERKKSDKFFKKNGFRFEECWNLDVQIARFVLPRLMHLKKVKIGHPANLNSMDEWDEIMDKMIEAFYLLLSNSYIPKSTEDEEKIKEGLALFAEYFQALWD